MQNKAPKVQSLVGKSSACLVLMPGLIFGQLSWQRYLRLPSSGDTSLSADATGVFAVVGSDCTHIDNAGKLTSTRLDRSLKLSRPIAQDQSTCWFLAADAVLAVELTTGHILSRISNFHMRVTQSVCSPGGALLVVGDSNGKCYTIRSGHLHQISLSSKSAITALAISADGTSCLVASLDGMVSVISLRTLKVIDRIKVDFPALSATYDVHRSVYWVATGLDIRTVPASRSRRQVFVEHLGQFASGLKSTRSGALLYVVPATLAGSYGSRPNPTSSPADIWAWSGGKKTQVGQTYCFSLGIEPSGGVLWYVGVDSLLHSFRPT